MGVQARDVHKQGWALLRRYQNLFLVVVVDQDVVNLVEPAGGEWECHDSRSMSAHGTMQKDRCAGSIFIA